jgi:hypothetical protein
VKFTGGTVVYAAPSPVPVPLVTPQPWEANGDYRLASIDQTTELPCFNDFNALRTANGLPTVIFDEWLVENAREAVLLRQNPAFVAGMHDPRNPWGYLATGNVAPSGGSDCSAAINSLSFTQNEPYSTDARTIWFGGVYIPASGNNSAIGNAEWLVDPRAAPDPNALPWP